MYLSFIKVWPYPHESARCFQDRLARDLGLGQPCRPIGLRYPFFLQRSLSRHFGSIGLLALSGSVSGDLLNLLPDLFYVIEVPLPGSYSSKVVRKYWIFSCRKAMSYMHMRDRSMQFFQCQAKTRAGACVMKVGFPMS